MLDANLPTFYLAKAAGTTNKNQSTFYLTRGGSEAEPAYSLRHADASTPAAKNCYAAALFDPYSTEVLYGEVLLRPQWTQPTLSAEEIRRNGGIPPPPEPLMPSEFVIQLYNPDQQVRVTQRFASLTGAPRWDFTMPQSTFRTPSGSALDRTQVDPTADATIPKLKFSWKKEKLSKDIGCYMTGKSTDMVKKKSKKEPDIAVAVFKSLKEITIYEPNLHRCELEDNKGLEVVLLLGAAVIRDIFFANNIKQAFNVMDTAQRTSLSTPGKLQAGRSSDQILASTTSPLPPTRPIGGSAALSNLYASKPSVPSSNQYARMSGALPPPPPPPTDPRTQWEIDAETARLKATAEAEAREFKRREDARRREREKADEEEARRLKRMVEAEEKERRRQLALVDQETERLKRIYGAPGSTSTAPLAPPPPAASNGYSQPGQTTWQMSPPQFPGPPNAGPSNDNDTRRKQKKSFWNLRGQAVG